MPAALAKPARRGPAPRSPLVPAARGGPLRFARLHVLVLIALAASACKPTPPPETQPNSGRVVVDALGRQVRVAERHARVVSLAPNLTEIVFAIGAGDRLVANTTFCDYPPDARAVEKVGNTLQPDLERIVALQPDVVLVSLASQLQETTRKLEAIGITVFVTSEAGLDAVFDTIERVGELLGEQARGRELAAMLRARAGDVRARVEGRPRPPVFVLVGDRPLITTGGNTFMNDLVVRAGGRSISADETSDWPQFSAEAVVARAPEAIVVPTSSHGIADGEAQLPEPLRATPAARSGRILRINADLLMRPGPRLVDGLEELARGLHPEAFP